MRQVWHRLPGPHSQEPVELAELYADGGASLPELSAARARIEEE
jgi:hypothetical protein